MRNQSQAVIARKISHPIGPDLTVTDFLIQVEIYRTLVDQYNDFLIKAEITRSKIRLNEKVIRDLKERVRLSTMIFNGKSSKEYKAFIKGPRARKKLNAS
ncbi:MAG: hypothetical protein H7X99_01845 [Saprospiraceae bacterium]|nr:hypothetical protein [Saprospiraceae bacterium]